MCTLWKTNDFFFTFHELSTCSSQVLLFCRPDFYIGSTLKRGEACSRFKISIENREQHNRFGEKQGVGVPNSVSVYVCIRKPAQVHNAVITQCDNYNIGQCTKCKSKGTPVRSPKKIIIQYVLIYMYTCILCTYYYLYIIQSTKELLQTFSCKYLSGEGDVVKHLAHFGYIVTHTQVCTYIIQILYYYFTNTVTILQFGGVLNCHDIHLLFIFVNFLLRRVLWMNMIIQLQICLLISEMD